MAKSLIQNPLATNTQGQNPNTTLLVVAGVAVVGYLLLSPKKKPTGLNAPKTKKSKAKKTKTGKKAKSKKTKK